jgi:hypothetical protein
VGNNTHQLPLGVLKFGTVDNATMARSNQRRVDLKRLSAEVVKHQAAVAESQSKALIIQLLIQEKFDLASEKYGKLHKLLKEESKREISMYAHDRLDADLVPFLLPDLPEPYGKTEFDALTSFKTVEKYEIDARDAKNKLDQARSRQGQPI